MFYFTHTPQEIEEELKRQIASEEARAEAWKNASISKRKNGEEYQNIGAALVNCQKGKYYPVEDGLHPYLTIVYKTPTGYEQDHTPIFYYVDELPETDGRKATKKQVSFLRATVEMTRDEMREAITNAANEATARAERLKEQLKHAPEMVKQFRTAIQKAINDLTEADKKLRGQDMQIFPTTLYHLITTTK